MLRGRCGRMTADKNCAHRQELTSWIHFIAFHKAISVATLLLLLVSLPSGQSSYHANEGGATDENDDGPGYGGGYGDGSSGEVLQGDPSKIEHQSFDGRNNNKRWPEWGAALSRRVRSLPTGHGFLEGTTDTPLDETNTPGLPSARRIMEELFRKVPPNPDKSLSGIMLALGEFITQDILLFNDNSTEQFDIPCDGDLTDLVFCPGRGQFFNMSETIPFHRAVAGTRDGVRATINEQTPYLDLSNIYGISEEESNNRRAPGGKLVLDEDGLYPEDKIGWVKGFSSPSSYAFMVIFARYHNMVADNWAESDPSLSDDDLFHVARRRTISVYQQIVEEKYIPVLLGDRLPTYLGYDQSVNPAIDEFFAAVAFRYGHSSVSGLIRILDKNFEPLPSDPLFLRDIFAQPPPNHIQSIVKRYGGIEPFVRGLVTIASKGTDASFVEDMNLYTSAASFKDVQRGRDVGIPRYNDVREGMGRGRGRLQSMEELANGDPVVLEALNELYGDNVDLVDAYVGALLEDPATYLNPLTPTLTWSISGQFERIRNGDRYWYRNIYSPEDYGAFPGLSDLIKLVCSDMELFPDEPYSVFVPGSCSADDEASCKAPRDLNKISLLGGAYTLGWSLDNYSGEDPSIDVTMAVNDAMDGPGFIGVGWRKRQMQGAHIWWCTIDADVFDTQDEPDTCSLDPPGDTTQERHVFSCCLSVGGLHFIPPCLEETDPIFYPLEVISSCASGENTVVKLRIPACSDSAEVEDSSTRRCFDMSSEPDGSIDFIVSYNLLAPNRPHGFQRRTSAQMNLRAGTLTEAEAGTADDGLIATHGVFMLFAWMILAPWAIFIVRYMKTSSWRLIAHVSMMGICGSLLVPMIIGVEASVGATEKTAEHALVGIILTSFFFVFAFLGRVRYMLHSSGKSSGKRVDFWSLIIHKYGGYIFVGLAWWNCYTGLVRIGPEDSFVQVVVFSSTSMGYDLPVFGIIRKYVYGPYIAFVILVFFVAEVRDRRLRSQSVEKILSETGSIWDDKDEESDLEPMTMETFLDVTRLGSALCIVDGRVLDITDFVNIHPGGPELLKYVRGSDITDELLGRRDVDGIKHRHSGAALRLLRKYVKARIAESSASAAFRTSEIIPEEDSKSCRNSSRISAVRTSRAGIYRRGRIIGVEYVTPNMPSSDSSRPVILLRVALPKMTFVDDPDDDILLPGTVYVFRGIDERGNMFDRQYTPVQIKRSDNFRDFSCTMGEAKQKTTTGEDNELELHEFLISLIPHGKMSKFLLSQKVGKVLLAQGPRINTRVLDKIDSFEWKTVVMIAGGTGVSPMIQLINYYLWLGVSEMPYLFLVWNLKSPNHGYEHILGLEDLERRANGKFKWTINYTTIEQDPNARPSLTTAIKTKFKDISHWTHKSLKHDKQQQKRGLLQRSKAIRPASNRRIMDLVASAEESSPKTDFTPSSQISVEFWNENKHETSSQITAALLQDILRSTEIYTMSQPGSTSGTEESDSDDAQEIVAAPSRKSNNAETEDPGGTQRPTPKAVNFSGDIVEKMRFKDTLVAVSGSLDFDTNMIEILSSSEVGLAPANMTIFQLVTDL